LYGTEYIFRFYQKNIKNPEDILLQDDEGETFLHALMAGSSLSEKEIIYILTGIFTPLSPESRIKLLEKAFLLASKRGETFLHALMNNPFFLGEQVRAIMQTLFEFVPIEKRNRLFEQCFLLQQKNHTHTLLLAVYKNSHSLMSYLVSHFVEILPVSQNSELLIQLVKEAVSIAVFRKYNAVFEPLYHAGLMQFMDFQDSNDALRLHQLSATLLHPSMLNTWDLFSTLRALSSSAYPPHYWIALYNAWFKQNEQQCSVLGKQKGALLSEILSSDKPFEVRQEIAISREMSNWIAGLGQWERHLTDHPFELRRKIVQRLEENYASRLMTCGPSWLFCSSGFFIMLTLGVIYKKSNDSRWAAMEDICEQRIEPICTENGGRIPSASAGTCYPTLQTDNNAHYNDWASTCCNFTLACIRALNDASSSIDDNREEINSIPIWLIELGVVGVAVCIAWFIGLYCCASLDRPVYQREETISDLPDEIVDLLQAPLVKFFAKMEKDGLPISDDAKAFHRKDAIEWTHNRILKLVQEAKALSQHYTTTQPWLNQQITLPGGLALPFVPDESSPTDTLSWGQRVLHLCGRGWQKVEQEVDPEQQPILAANGAGRTYQSL
jgi:hypothetical protein